LNLNDIHQADWLNIMFTGFYFHWTDEFPEWALFHHCICSTNHSCKILM